MPAALLALFALFGEAACSFMLSMAAAMLLPREVWQDSRERRMPNVAELAPESALPPPPPPVFALPVFALTEFTLAEFALPVFGPTPVLALPEIALPETCAAPPEGVGAGLVLLGG